MPDVAPDEGATAVPDDPVVRALRDAERAEALQRQYAAQPQQPQPNDGLTEPQRQFLQAHPRLRSDPAALMYYATRAIRRGIEQDSPEFFQSILDGFSREYEVGVEHANRMAGNMAQPHRAETEAREQAEEIISHAQAMLPDVPLPPAETPKAAAPSSPRRSIPYSAPVHRDVPSVSGQRMADMRVTLTAEERDIARRSFTAADMTDEMKEKLYALNKAKLARLRATGQYHRTTDEHG
jgi:hypothetical protein